MEVSAGDVFDTERYGNSISIQGNDLFGRPALKARHRAEYAQTSRRVGVGRGHGNSRWTVSVGGDAQSHRRVRGVRLDLACAACQSWTRVPSSDCLGAGKVLETRTSDGKPKRSAKCCVISARTVEARAETGRRRLSAAGARYWCVTRCAPSASELSREPGRKSQNGMPAMRRVLSGEEGSWGKLSIYRVVKRAGVPSSRSTGLRGTQVRVSPDQ